ncbi:cubilin-like [Pomacea canaliculata]|uniref:cubilin-like n=1 Tax=Pomacea canaliculata TaxID=400727 RepID=UPI000D731C4A|nr:cubilin-like [Pomacea canaliculata]
MLRILLLISGLRAVQSASCALGSDVIKLRSWSGGFQSPGWAENLYPNDQQCQWDIQVSQGSRVNLTFKSFSLEEGVYRNSPPTSTKICRDVVKIADDTNVLFSGCGTDGDGMSFLSSGNNMTIIFHADESLNEQGFEAFYEGVCERNITSNMVLESPGFPDSPPDNVTCQWTVESNQSALILIRPPEDELQRFPECNDSSIKWESSSLAPDSPLQTKALCRTDSVALSLNNVVLTYEPKASDLAWIGRLEIKYTNSGDCKDFCTQNIQECLSPRVVAYDYRCICKCGYHGVNCEVYEDPCVAKNCSGSCTVVGTGSDFE